MQVAAPAEPFLAIGIVSAPVYVERRALLRVTWMRHLNVGRTVTAHFVVRAKGAPSLLQQQLSHEHRTHNDVVLLQEVQWNESQLRGPILSLMGWFASTASLAMFRSAQYIAKVDDDTYVHTIAAEKLLRTAFARLPHERVYSGPMTYFGSTKLFGRSGLDWTGTLCPCPRA